MVLIPEGEWELLVWVDWGTLGSCGQRLINAIK